MVVDVVLTPGQMLPDEDDEKRQIYQSLLHDEDKPMLLRVVVEETLTEIVVITAYTTSQIQRYWK